MQADSIDHAESINFKNEIWTIDKWFLKDNENVTFGQVIDYLNQENIVLEIIPAYKGSEEQIIRCVNSKVTFDFVNEISKIELDENGNFVDREVVIVNNQSDYILNGIRLFKS